MTIDDCYIELDLLNTYMKGVFIPLKSYQLFRRCFPAFHKKAFNGEGAPVYIFESQIPAFEEYKQSPFWINSKSYLQMRINEVTPK